MFGFGLGPQELVIVGVVAVLLFGKRLPEVARSVGKSYHEFKRGLADIGSAVDVRESLNTSSPPPSYSDSHDDYDDYEEATAPKFEPPPGEPKAESGSEPKAESGSELGDSAEQA